MRLLGSSRKSEELGFDCGLECGEHRKSYLTGKNFLDIHSFTPFYLSFIQGTHYLPWWPLACWCGVWLCMAGTASGGTTGREVVVKSLKNNM